MSKFTLGDVVILNPYIKLDDILKRMFVSYRPPFEKTGGPLREACDAVRKVYLNSYRLSITGINGREIVCQCIDSSRVSGFWYGEEHLLHFGEKI